MSRRNIHKEHAEQMEIELAAAQKEIVFYKDKLDYYIGKWANADTQLFCIGSLTELEIQGLPEEKENYTLNKILEYSKAGRK